MPNTTLSQKCLRRQRPRGRAAEQRDEVAPFHRSAPPVLFDRKDSTQLSMPGHCCAAGFESGACRLGVRTRPFGDVGSMSGLPESGSRSALLRCRKSGTSDTGPATPSPWRTGRGIRDRAEGNLWNGESPSPYSGLMPANLITLVHFSIFSAMHLANSFGELGGTANTPRAANLCWMFGSSTAALVCLLSVAMISGGVPLGAPKPIQAAAS